MVSRKVFVSSDMSIDEGLIAVAEQSSESALLWPWLLTAFDDWGRSEANARRLKARVFPAIAHVTPDLINEALRLYAEYGLIAVYTVRDKQYMAIDPAKWFKYQTHIRRDKRDKDESKIPPPPAFDADGAEMQASARECAEIRADARECIPSPSPSPSPTDLPLGMPARVDALDDFIAWAPPLAPLRERLAQFPDADLRRRSVADDLARFLVSGVDLAVVAKGLQVAADAGKGVAYALGTIRGYVREGYTRLDDWSALPARPASRASPPPRETALSRNRRRLAAMEGGDPFDDPPRSDPAPRRADGGLPVLSADG